MDRDDPVAAPAHRDERRLHVHQRPDPLDVAPSTCAQVPALLEQVAIRGTDASLARGRISAINAIAAVTGFDRRYDEAGEPRQVTPVAAEVLAACAD